jgi:predicted nucleic-acid-binding protein
MIGVDSNVLLRFFVVDDPHQHRQSRAFFAARTEDDPAYVNVVVLVELVWLMSRRYRLKRPEIVDALRALLESLNIEIESRELVAQAVDTFSRRRNAGFADLLIAALNTRADCRSTATFDVPASEEIPGMELLK